MTVLRSFVSGSWWLPSDDGEPVRDAVTGSEVARLSTTGLDLAEVVGYGRKVGGAALRELGFLGRAAVLASLADRLKEHRQELFELSQRSGSTRRDAGYDVDGGIAVVTSYARLGRRALPEGNLLVDGPTETLSRGGHFVGQHVLTPRRGVAVQINAFNFPVWGPLEKFAPAFLAGVPSVIKPASATAYLTHRLVELMVADDLLPAGALQLVAGSVGDLFDHLAEQDLVSFTGSAATAATLRSHPALLARSVRFNAEADSLNCSVLGPDAGPGSPEFELYVEQLVTEMTVKAGQKCTAIRRALVPDTALEAVVEAVADRLAKVVVGHPADPTVTMGPLVSKAQRAEVLERLAQLASAARIAVGDPEQVTVVGADPDRGAFVAPVLLVADDPERAELHDVEVFGPVSTVIGYRDAEHAATLAARGRGSLAGSVVSADPRFVTDLLGALAPWHGRLLVLDRHDAAESTGHGSPLPSMVHGGPGRAGGGEELGGLRAVVHHLQRTAVQGSPAVVSALTHRWLPGAPQRTDGPHPFAKSLSELRLGDAVVAGPKVVTAQDIERFAELTGDTFYAHTDPVAAAANPLFGGIVAHGYLVVALAAGLFVRPDPGPVLANYGVDDLRFVSPVRVGDELSVTLTCKQITARPDADYGEVRWDAHVTKHDGSTAARYDVLTMVAKTWPAS